MGKSRNFAVKVQMQMSVFMFVIKTLNVWVSLLSYLVLMSSLHHGTFKDKNIGLLAELGWVCLLFLR